MFRYISLCTCLDEIANEKVEIEQEKLKNLEEECKKKILGQDEIVKEVCEIVKTAFLVGGEKPCVILLGGGTRMRKNITC